MPICKRAGCRYSTNNMRTTANNLFCCKMCMKGKGHGPACQKYRIRPRVVAVINSVSIISWGDSVYGEYIVFNFKTNIVTTITSINYKIYLGSTVLLQGTLPYIFANSQIIYTDLSIIDKNVTLELSLKLPGGTVSNSKTSSLTNLNSSPYINCDYFKQGSNITTTTTKATTTKATTTTSATTTTNNTTSNTTITTTNANLIPLLRRKSDGGQKTYTNTLAYPSGTKISVLLIGGGGGGTDASVNGYGGTGAGISFTYVFANGLGISELIITNVNDTGNTTYYGYSNVAYKNIMSIAGAHAFGIAGGGVSITFLSGATTFSIIANGGGGGNAVGPGTGGELAIVTPSNLLTSPPAGFVIKTSGGGLTGALGAVNGYIANGGDPDGIGGDNTNNLSLRGKGGQPGVSGNAPSNGYDGYWSLIIDPYPT